MTENEPLTYAALCEMNRQWRREFSAPALPRIIEVEPIPIYGPVKRHRKRRIQKKWLKRYGQKIVGYDRYLGDQIYIDGRKGVAYCHPDIAQQARYMAMQN